MKIHCTTSNIIVKLDLQCIGALCVQHRKCGKTLEPFKNCTERIFVFFRHVINWFTFQLFKRGLTPNFASQLSWVTQFFFCRRKNGGKSEKKLFEMHYGPWQVRTLDKTAKILCVCLLSFAVSPTLTQFVARCFGFQKRRKNATCWRPLSIRAVIKNSKGFWIANHKWYNLY